MKKNSEVQRKRKALIELAINNPKEAARYFEFAALSLREARNTKQVLEIMSNTLFLSERTITNDTEKIT